MLADGFQCLGDEIGARHRMAEKIGRKVDRMDANQRRRTCSQLSLDERDMLRAIDQVAIDDHAEGITFAFERHLDYTLDAPLSAPQIGSAECWERECKTG